ncbi:MAG TPA: arylsulfatase [Terrimicrobiaceae bacterium]|nr:arylsulfatase [Terrimicrobiaceae bacterium]
MSHVIRPKKKPNLLFITTDQQRGDCLGCDGHPVLETPYLDELAGRGCLFSRAYSAVPSCIPARAAIMTGMNQWNHGRLTMDGVDLLDFPATLPGELGGAGYQTQAVGKMHFYPQRACYGFQNMVLDESGRRRGRFVSDYDEWFEQNKDGPYGSRDHSVDWNSWMARPSHLPEHLHPTWWTASEGIRFLRNRDASRPFFLWLSFARPHSPYDPPAAYFDMYDRKPNIPAPAVGDWAERYGCRIDNTNAPLTQRSPEEIRRARVGYYGSITFIDHQIGRLLYEFRHTDAETFANTMIVFTSDHGDMLGDHHHWRKTYAYEGSARVPMIVAPPPSWGLPANERCARPVELQDVMPTLLDAAGVEIPPSVDGRSMLPLLDGQTSEWREHIQGEHSYCQKTPVKNSRQTAFATESGMQYVTDGREKYIWFHETGQEQFFDLETDPRECHDLSAEESAQSRIAKWRKILADINEKRGDPRGANGVLIPTKGRAPGLSPNYKKWKRRAQIRLRRLGIDPAKLI